MELEVQHSRRQVMGSRTNVPRTLAAPPSSSCHRRLKRSVIGIVLMGAAVSYPWVSASNALAWVARPVACRLQFGKQIPTQRWTCQGSISRPRQTQLRAKGDESSDVAEDVDMFHRFAAFVEDMQAEVLADAEAAEDEARRLVGAPQPQFLRQPWERPGGRGMTAVLEGGRLWEKAAASVSVLEGKLSQDRAESLSSSNADEPTYTEGEPYRACALSLVFHARHPKVPTLRGDIRCFEIPGRQECWFGGGADLTPVYLFNEDAVDFHKFWRGVCKAAAGQEKGERVYAEMKQDCDNYFYIPARKEHRGVGGLFFDRLTDAKLGEHGSAEDFTKRVAKGWMKSYLPIVKKRCKLEETEEMRQWQLLRRGRYVEFNLLYDRGVRFGLAQLEKVMVSAPPMVAWSYGAPIEGGSEPVAPAGMDADLLEVLKQPHEWAFKDDEGELVPFAADGSEATAGILPLPVVTELGLKRLPAS
mmetsp:Transcript_940/g.2041  ORF Transcript_940/g.2041 Transcript_940/m.2041 type:complete len:473 (+) Transcript_940:50-1468(+)